MAVSVFGVTNTIVASDYWPGFTLTSNSTPSDTRLTSIIEKVGAEINGYIVAAGGTPGDIDSSGEPISYAWCAETLGLGSAAAMGRGMSGVDNDLAKEYQRLYEQRIKLLIHKPEVALADHYDDISEPQGEVRSHIKDLGLSDAGEDAGTYEPTLRIEDDL